MENIEQPSSAAVPTISDKVDFSANTPYIEQAEKNAMASKLEQTDVNVILPKPEESSAIAVTLNIEQSEASTSNLEQPETNSSSNLEQPNVDAVVPLLIQSENNTLTKNLEQTKANNTPKLEQTNVDAVTLNLEQTNKNKLAPNVALSNKRKATDEGINKLPSKPPRVKPQPIVNPNARKYTVSLAIPGSIVANAQSQELRSYLVGQIARGLAIFNIDEIIIFNDGLTITENEDLTGEHKFFKPSKSIQQPNLFLARVLQYIETPQYLRKELFPIHRDLEYAGLLNPLDSPHHLRADEASKYREGVTLNKPVKARNGSFVNCGFIKPVAVDKLIKPGVRVTVELDEFDRDPKTGKRNKNCRGKVVSLNKPREVDGIYWGYQVRLASSLSKVFDESPYKGGYDLKIGTSERGDSIDSETFQLPEFNHLLIVLGGVQGLEASVEVDEALLTAGGDASLLFDFWLNTCPKQGSRTIRTEEAMLVTLAALRPQIQSKGIK